MDRRAFLIGGAGLTATATLPAAGAEPPSRFPPIPREEDPLAQASGAPVFTAGPLAKNPVAAMFGHVPGTQPLPAEIAYLDAGGPRAFTQLTGKIRILALWAEWAQPSVRLLPDLAALQTKFGGERFEILAVRTGGREPVDYAAARKIVDAAGASALPLWIEADNGYMTMAMVRSARTTQTLTEGQPSVPAAVLIDETGAVRGRMIGIRTTGKPRTPIPANLPPAERRMAVAMADRPTIWTAPEAEAFIKELIDGGLG